MDRAIIGFHLDEEQHWVADLSCGHTRHVRHQPPWHNRPWVVSEEGRASMLGQVLDCVHCEEEMRATPS
jgi:hypothetical protein